MTSAGAPAAQVAVHGDAGELARAVAARLTASVVDAQTARGSASVVLTGGRNGNAVLAALATSPGRHGVDWSQLDVWWGDERFEPDGDPERNVTQARETLLDGVPLEPSRVHAMAASDGAYGNDAEAAAEAYATELAAAAGAEGVAGAAGHGAVPSFDVLLLGVGPDTHVASLFPGLSGVRERERTVVAVRDAPKPPPVRLSLTLTAIRAAREVWLLAAGADKADAVATALAPAASPDPAQVPAAGAYGQERTLWFLDEEAAARLPAEARPRPTRRKLKYGPFADS